MTKSAKELRDHANKFIAYLNTQRIKSAIVEDSFRDYLVKIEIDGRGRINLYHSPKKNTFSLITTELHGDDLRKKIEAHHETFAAQSGIALKGESTGSGVKSPKNSSPVPKGWAAYVDGSFADDQVGYGVAILKDGALQAELSGIAAIPTEDTQARQIGGELTATMKAVEWCIAHDVPQVTICYDLVNIRHWALAEWKANIPLTRRYQSYMQDVIVSGKLGITWQKVDAHTGDKWNEHVDKLARGAAQYKTG